MLKTNLGVVSQSKVEKLIGHAKFTADKCVEVAGERYEAKHIVIATGGRPIIPGFPGNYICLLSVCLSVLSVTFCVSQSVHLFLLHSFCLFKQCVCARERACVCVCICVHACVCARTYKCSM